MTRTGSTDAFAKSLRHAEQIGGTAFSKNPAVVENKPGAGGRIARESVKAAAPDGSTLLHTRRPICSNPIVRRDNS